MLFAFSKENPPEWAEGVASQLFWSDKSDIWETPGQSYGSVVRFDAAEIPDIEDKTGSHSFYLYLSNRVSPLCRAVMWPKEPAAKRSRVTSGHAAQLSGCLTSSVLDVPEAGQFTYSDNQTPGNLIAGCLENLVFSRRNQVLHEPFFQFGFGVEDFATDGCIRDHVPVSVFLQGARADMQQPAKVSAAQVAFAAQSRLSALVNCLQLVCPVVDCAEQFPELLRVVIDCVVHR